MFFGGLLNYRITTSETKLRGQGESPQGLPYSNLHTIVSQLPLEIGVLLPAHPFQVHIQLCLVLELRASARVF